MSSEKEEQSSQNNNEHSSSNNEPKEPPPIPNGPQVQLVTEGKKLPKSDKKEEISNSENQSS